MEDEKDRFGEKIRLLEKAREDIYFAAKDRELIERLRAALKKAPAAQPGNHVLACPKCAGPLESYSFMEFLLDRCEQCGGVWLDRGELEGILKKAARGPFSPLVDWFLRKERDTAKEGDRR